MLDSECNPGVKVICRDNHYRNYVGYIITVIRTDGKVASYVVKDKIVGGIFIGGSVWYALSCWDLYPYQQESVPNTLRSASVPKKSIICPCGISRKDCDYHKE